MVKAERNLYYIVLVALILRSLFILCIHVFPSNPQYHANDSKEYLSLAQELVSHGRFVCTLMPGSLAHPFTPEIVRTPGYPWFLVPGVWLNHVYLVTTIFQIILGCLTVVYIFRLALLLFGEEKSALIAAFIFAIDPMSIFFTPYLLTETLFTFLITIFVYVLIKYLNQRLLKDLTIAGFILAAVIFVRPIAYFLPVYLVIALVIYNAVRGQLKKEFMVQAGIFLCCSLIPVGLWQVRNYACAGYSDFSAISTVNLYFYNSAAVQAKLQKVSYVDLQVDMGLWGIEDYFKVHPEQRSWTDAERFRYMAETGAKIIKDNISTYGRLHLEGMLRVIFDPGIVKFFKLFGYQSDQFQFIKYYVDNGLVKTIKVIFYEKRAMFFFYLIFAGLLALIILFACLALLSRSVHYNLPVIVLLLIIVYFLVLSGGPGDGPRFRLPTMPLLAILAGFGVTAYGKQRKAIRG